MPSCSHSHSHSHSLLFLQSSIKFIMNINVFSIIIIFFCAVECQDYTQSDPSQVTHPSNSKGYVYTKGDVNTTVPTKGIGTFVGFISTIQFDTAKKHDINVFLGIPYARPPTGDFRFKLPSPAYLDSSQPWISKKYSNRCVQWNFTFNIEFLNLSSKHYSEDCLYLNVFTPTLSRNAKKLPVMVHIHGGSLLVGGARGYPGQMLAAHDMVVVTMNYRLNSFGLMTTSSWELPGNLALWDQRMAMQWVQDNIEHFGGDLNSVTLSGESAGASSVGLHILSNQFYTKPLFHRAILMSGADTAHWAVSRPFIGMHRAALSIMSSKLDCHKTTVYDNLNCIMTKSTADIENASYPINSPEFFEPEWLWAPIVDGVFLQNFPLILRRAGNFRRVPVLLGTTKHDITNILKLDARRDLYHFFQLLITGKKGKSFKNEAFLINMLKNLYLAGKEERYLTANEIYELKQAAMIDFDMTEPTHRVAYFHALFNQSAYFYQFEFPNATDQNGLINHGFDLPYQWGYPFLDNSWWEQLSNGIIAEKKEFALDRMKTQVHKNMSLFMMKLWSNFVKFGNPTPEPVNGFMWPTVKVLTPPKNGADAEIQINCARLISPNKSTIDPFFKKKYMNTWKYFYDMELEFALFKRYSNTATNLLPLHFTVTISTIFRSIYVIFI